MQEDKEAVFDAVDTVKSCLSVFTGMLKSLTFHTDAMYQSAKGGYTNATDAADWLVKKGMSFRQAHEIVGRLVLYAIEKKKTLDELSLDELKAISESFDKTVYDAISVGACVDARDTEGGPAADAVQKAIEKAEATVFNRNNYK
ncbi:MAG: argininosuccinate lyase, partial [Oscillospiraceae bacterium]|nr:argininosuccinate lyase [Oscillospiraceae bacterium]